jgi:hypothetical protein
MGRMNDRRGRFIVPRRTMVNLFTTNRVNDDTTWFANFIEFMERIVTFRRTSRDATGTKVIIYEYV